GQQVRVPRGDRLAQRWRQRPAQLGYFLLRLGQRLARRHQGLELQERPQALDLVQVDPDLAEQEQLAHLLYDRPDRLLVRREALAGLGLGVDREAAHLGLRDIGPLVEDPLDRLAGDLAAFQAAFGDAVVRVRLTDCRDRQRAQRCADRPRQVRVTQFGLELDVLHRPPPRRLRT